jgi:hypothetical protein
MERRFDAPRPTSFAFNHNDQRKMARVQQEIVDLLIRMQREDGRIETGILALACANVCRDLLDQYPANFREKIIKEINRQIFAVAPTPDGPRLISIH